jgi:hypothetical protein
MSVCVLIIKLTFGACPAITQMEQQQRQKKKEKEKFKIDKVSLMQ